MCMNVVCMNVDVLCFVCVLYVLCMNVDVSLFLSLCVVVICVRIVSATVSTCVLCVSVRVSVLAIVRLENKQIPRTEMNVILCTASCWGVCDKTACRFIKVLEIIYTFSSG